MFATSPRSSRSKSSTRMEEPKTRPRSQSSSTRAREISEKWVGGGDCEDSMDESTCVTPSSLNYTTIYLRLKPSMTRENDDAEKQDSLYWMLNATTLIAKSVCHQDCNTKSSRGPRANDNSLKRFTFARIFDQEATQAVFFEQVAMRPTLDFLSGHSSTVMAYGTSNSGKTHTLIGTLESPGIVPRSIELVFSLITCNLRPWYKLAANDLPVGLSDQDRESEFKRSWRILNSRHLDRWTSAIARESLDSVIEDRSSVEEFITGDVGEWMYSMCLSFAEIYMENVYDLLNFNVEERKEPLRLITDKNGVAFIQGLTKVYVTTAAEACRLLWAGQARACIERTSLNRQSSRSHTIFSLRLLKYRRENTPDQVIVSSLTFCDLAGTGRFKKTKETGERVAEARNINNSLLVLGRCFKVIHDGRSTGKQKNVDGSVAGPFRESKLTRMFQRALSGKERVVIIANVDPFSGELQNETHAVLNVCALAGKLVTEYSGESRKSVAPSHTPKDHDAPEVSATSATGLLSKDSISSYSVYVTGKMENRELKEQLKKSMDTIGGQKREILRRFRERCVEIIDRYRTKYEGITRKTRVVKNLKTVGQCHEISVSLSMLREEYALMANEKKKNVEAIFDNLEILAKNVMDSVKNSELEDRSESFESFESLRNQWKSDLLIVEASLSKAEGYEEEAPSPSQTENASSSTADLANSNALLREEIDNLKRELDESRNNVLDRELKVRQELANHYSDLIENIEASWKRRATEVESEGQNLLKWSVEQIESFYKERIDSITRGRKRRRNEMSMDDDEIDAFEDLRLENTEITSKVVVLRDTLKKLREENRIITAQKHAFTFELSLSRNKLKGLRELVNSDSIELDSCDDEDDEVGKLKRSMIRKTEIIRALKEDLKIARQELSALKTETSGIPSESPTEMETRLGEKIDNSVDREKLRERKMIDVGTDWRDNDESSGRSDNNNWCPYCGESKLSSMRETRVAIHKFARTMDDSFFNNVTNEPTTLTVQAHVALKKIHEYNEKNPRKQMRFDASSVERDSFLDVFSSSVDCSSFLRSSDVVSKNDSGIALGSSSLSGDDSAKLCKMEEKDTQTLCKASEDAKEVTTGTIETEERSDTDRRIINELESKTAFLEGELRRLTRINAEMAARYNEMTKTLETRSSKYEDKINELKRKLRSSRENKRFAAEYFGEYMGKVLSLAMGYVRSRRMCTIEHIPELERLERDLRSKDRKIDDLGEELRLAYRDLAKLNCIREKMDRFQILFDKYQRERGQLQSQLQYQMEIQSNLQAKLDASLTEIEKRELNVMSMKESIESIVHMNDDNNKRSKYLGDELYDIQTDVCLTKEELSRVVESRKNFLKVNKDAAMRKYRVSTEKASKEGKIPRSKKKSRDSTRLSLVSSRLSIKYFDRAKRKSDASKSSRTFKRMQNLRKEATNDRAKLKRDERRRPCTRFGTTPNFQSPSISSNDREEFKTTILNGNDKNEVKYDNETNDTSCASIEGQGKMSGWMKIRRIDAQTMFPLNTNKDNINILQMDDDSSS